jgi:hypothetical protein
MRGVAANGGGLQGWETGVRRLLWVGVVVAVIALLCSGRAVGDAWVASRLAQPPLPTGQLSAVSCPSTRFCAALGQSSRGPLAMTWDGRAWSLRAPPAVSAGSSTTLALSCASARFCVAMPLGSPRGTRVVFDVWDGVRWSAGGLPSSVTRPGEVVNAVTCRSPRFCVLVGWMRNSRGRTVELAQRWSGARWLVQQVPEVAGARASGLEGVSCPSVRLCVAVGTALRRAHERRKASPPPVSVGFIDAWDGKGWARQRVSRMPLSSGLSDVSCASLRACVAVGDGGAGHQSGERGPLVEGWNGRRWTLYPNAADVDTGGYGDSQFTHISCASATVCVAVGRFDYANGGDGYGSGYMTERWNGKRWIEDRVSGGEGPAGAIETDSVSCANRHACTVVGSDDGDCEVAQLCQHPVATYATGWSGHGWSQQTTPGAGTPGTVSPAAAVCTSSTACIVGGSTTKANGAPGSIAETWNGTSWAIEPVPGDGLGSLTCVSTRRCLAYTNLGSVDPVLLSWNGSSWARFNPQPPTMIEPVMICRPDGSCLATGFSPSSNADVAVFWTGAGWTVMRLTQTGRASSVSCAPTAPGCAAVGGQPDSAGQSHQLAETWNGTSWDAFTFSQSGTLTTVSCPSTTFCLATGSTVGFQVAQAATAVSWNGSQWASLPTTPGVIPTAVSCASPTSCYAVSNMSNDIHAWDGQSWTEQPAAPGTGDLTNISCDAENTCVAVGAADDGTGIVERNH